MFGMKTQIDSRCRITGDPVNIRQSGKIIENPDEAGELHIGIAWGAADADSSCADSLCLEMMFLRDGDIAQQWLRDDLGNREIFTLPEAVEFAGRFFCSPYILIIQSRLPFRAKVTNDARQIHFVSDSL